MRNRQYYFCGPGRSHTRYSEFPIQASVANTGSLILGYSGADLNVINSQWLDRRPHQTRTTKTARLLGRELAFFLQAHMKRLSSLSSCWKICSISTMRLLGSILRDSIFRIPYLNLTDPPNIRSGHTIRGLCGRAGDAALWWTGVRGQYFAADCHKSRAGQFG